MEDILSQLNEAQRKAVVDIEGPCMVIAGAGSGKTRVLTYRIAYMIEQGISPFNILALTFTNKAAQEMKDRIIQLLGSGKGRYVWMGTFHSIFSKVLHIEAEYLGFTSNFTIYDTDDCKNLIKIILKENNLDTQTYKPSNVLSAISKAKTQLITPEDYCKSPIRAEEDKIKRMPELGRIYSLYQNKLKRSDAMDFDDLLVNMYVLLWKFPDLLLKYQHKFRYILVDEYQDTSLVQYKIIQSLAAAYENICVVGDDAQSIYSFRGANISNILGFQKDYPECKIYKLEQNYRSTKNIITAANSVIAHNKHQIPKLIWTSNNSGDKIQLTQLSTDLEEALYVSKKILEMKQVYGYKNEDFVVMYRVNSQSRNFEEAFLRMGIPYRIYGGLSFYNRKEIKDIMAYFRLSVNFKDEEALRRIINYPTRGIGTTTMDKVIACAAEKGVSMWEVVENPILYGLNLSGRTINALDMFVNKIKSYHAQLQTLDAYQLGKYIIQTSGIEQDLKLQAEEKERYDNMQELLNALQNFVERPADTRIDMETGEDLQDKFPSLDLFLNEASLYSDSDKDDEPDSDKVKLMTIHATKGLEFPCVFIVGVEEGLLPHMLLSDACDLEEERRLFYVAITRAKEHLCISHAQCRMRYGSADFCEPSTFLDEIDPQVLNTQVKQESKEEKRDYYYKPIKNNTAFHSTSKPVFRQVIRQMPVYNTPKNVAQEDNNLHLAQTLLTAADSRTGMKVYHSTFGKGVIVEINADRVKVDFEKSGQKVLLYQFAKIRQIIEE